MENSNLYLLVGLAFCVYLSFAFGMLYVNRKVETSANFKTIIFLPILFSFIVGFSVLLYAISGL